MTDKRSLSPISVSIALITTRVLKYSIMYIMNGNICSYFRKQCDIDATALFVCGQSVFIYQTKYISLE